MGPSLDEEIRLTRELTRTEYAAPLAEARERRWTRWRSDVLLAVVVLLLAVPVVQPLMAQQASRYALTAAMYDQQTVVIDDYAAILSVDRASRGGHLYSDKAPGQPVFALPAYAAYRLVGGEPGTAERFLGNLGLWAVSLWSSALPAALLAMLMRRLALRIAPERATIAALAVAVGTMLLPFSTQLFSHVLSALCGLGAYLLLLHRPTDPRWLFASGFVAAFGVTVEYTFALVGVVLFAYAVLRHAWRSGWFLAGGIMPGIGLAAYHWIAFGGPFQFSYNYSAFAAHHSGVVGVQAPSTGLLVEILLGDRGIFLITPVMLLGVIGAALLLADARRREHGAVALAVFGLHIVMMAGWGNATGGASPGPRYIVASLPFLVVGVAEVWRRWPPAGWFALAVSAFTMGLATFTLPLAPRNVNGMSYWFERAATGDWADTIFTGIFGDWTLALPIILAACLAAWLVWSENGMAARSTAGMRPCPRDQWQLQR